MLSIAQSSTMLSIAQSSTLPVHHAMTQQVHEIWAKLYYRMKCSYCTLYWHTSLHRGPEACHVLPTICLILQGLRVCCRWSEARHAFYILLTICSCDSLGLLGLLLILSAEIIWYLYLPVVWKFIATVTAHFLMLTTALRWGHSVVPNNCKARNKNTMWSRAMSHEWIYARATARTSKMADRCTNTAATQILYLRKEAVLRKNTF